jgi:hypothetical protein
MRVLAPEELQGQETLQQEKCTEQRNTEVASSDSFHVSLRNHLWSRVLSARHAEYELNGNIFKRISLIFKVYID